MIAAYDIDVPDFRARSRVDGKVFVVAGAGAGIGRQTVHALAQMGAARVVCADIDAERAEWIAQECSIGVPWSGDITTQEGCRQLAHEASRSLGAIDGLVSVVGGVETWAPFVDTTEETWAADIRLNLGPVCHLAREFVSYMTSSGSTMTFVASTSGIYPAVDHAAYGAAKAAVIHLVQTLAIEFGRRGIRVNAVAPGGVRTPRMVEGAGGPGGYAAIESRSAAMSPLGVPGDASDIAAAILALSCDLTRWITGTTLVVDGDKYVTATALNWNATSPRGGPG
jgi:NAD(P)-dependent dehydrogenase (short-subunit alcohol dehydrogenase family)